MKKNTIALLVRLLIAATVIFLFFGPLNRKELLQPVKYTPVQTSGIDDLYKGMGKVTNPYLIEDAEDLTLLREVVNDGNSCAGVYFLQTADIDLGDSLWRQGIGGTEETPFSGNYNGGGHTVSGLKVISGDAAGFFGYLRGTVCNLGVAGEVTSRTTAGGIAGCTPIPNALIYNCYSEVQVAATPFVGCAGGLVGRNAGTILYGFSCGTTSSAYTHEISPYNTGFFYGCSLKAPWTMSTDDRAMGTAERSPDAVEEKKRFTERTRQIKAKTLWSQAVDLLFYGDGTHQEPYQIRTPEDLCLMRNLVNQGWSFSGQWLRQTQDLDLGAIANWVPIGKFDSGRYFKGVYDGAGHCIRNLTCTWEDNVGLFGTLSGTVMNLGVESGFVEGACVGGIASHSDGTPNCRIYNCYNNASLHGFARAGGIADNFMGGTVENCVNYGTVMCDDAEWAAELLSYAGTASHSVIVRPDRQMELVDSDAVMLADPEQICDYLNENLKSLSEHSGNKNNDFVCWDADASQALLSERRYLYSLEFFKLEAALVILIAVVCLGWCCFKNQQSPGEMIHDWRGQWKTVPWNRKCITLICMSGLFLTLLGLLMGDSGIFYSAIWLDGQDTFMDFYNPMHSMHSGNITSERYYMEGGGNYPPIARSILWLFGNSIPSDIMSSSPFAVRNRTQFLYVILIITVVFALYRMLGKCNHKHNNLMFVIAVSSAPFIYAIERGNVILLSFLFSFYFFVHYDDDAPAARLSSDLALSLAAGIKIYPAAYGLMLVDCKQWKRSISTALCGLTVFLFPFLFVGGYSAFLTFWNNLSGFSTVNQTYFRFWLLNYKNVVTGIAEAAGMTEISSGFLNYSLFAVTILLAFSALIANCRWKKLLAITLIIILFPGASPYYTATFYLIPLMAAFQESRSESWVDKLLITNLTLTIAPLQFLGGVYGLTGNDIEIFVGRIGLLMALLLIGQTLYQIMHRPFSPKYARA